MEYETKSQRKRAAFDYRQEYFRKNPGLFGCIWFCAYCGIPILGKSGVQVDHIVPLAGLGINRTFNTVAACPRCNRLKSDKGGFWIVRGSFSKVLESTLFTLQKLILRIGVSIARLFHTIIRVVCKILFLPVSYTTGVTRVIILLLYVGLVLLLLKACAR